MRNDAEVNSATETTTIKEQSSSEISMRAGRWGFLFRGVDAQHIFIALLILFSSAAVIWDSRANALRDIQQHEFLSQLLSEVIVNQHVIIDAARKQFEAIAETSRQQIEASTEASRVNSYLLTITQEKREAFRLTMPESLRKQTRQ